MHPSLNRDATDLVKRGVTPARIQKFKTDTAAFGEMEPDTVLQQEGAAVTQEKDAVQEALETAMQAVLSVIELKDDVRSARYKRFGVTNVTELSQPKLAATMLVKQGRKYLDEYVEQGLTEQMLTDVATQNAAFVDGLADRKEAERTRSGATRARVLFGNGLYRQLVQLCAAGDSYWKLTNATKAPDYVVDTTTPTAKYGSPAPTKSGAAG